MAHQGRLHARSGYYLIRELFRPGLEILVADPTKTHTQERAERIAARRARYETYLNYAVTRWRVRIHAHCWLPDSALLFMQIRYAPLEWFMHSLRAQFAQYIHREMDIRGVYAGRYRALLVDGEEFFWDVTRYVLERPVAEALGRSEICCEYSAAAACLGHSFPAFLAESRVLMLAQSQGINTLPGLLRFFRRKPLPGFQALVERGSLSDARVLGRADFVHQSKTEAYRLPTPPTPERIIEWVARRLRIPSSDIVTLGRRTRAVTARALVAWLTSCSGVAPVSAVARWFSASDRSSLERAISAHSRNYPELFSDHTLEVFYSFVQPDVEQEKRPSEIAYR